MHFLSLSLLHSLGRYSDRGLAEASFLRHWNTGPLEVEDASCVNFFF